jgi:ribosomal protein L3 glutamine methyltransferase
MKTKPYQLQTLRDWVRWGASRFQQARLCFGHGTDNALDESLALVLHAVHLDHDLPPAFLDCRVVQDEAGAILELLQRRLRERMPAAYLTGRAWFAGLEFEVTPDVLVPRSPIAELVERGFEPWRDADEVGRVLDLATGSGCIAVAAAHYLPQALVDAVDLSPAALEVARHNRDRHGLGERLELYCGDLFHGLPEGSRYDLIVSNPPYVSRQEYDSLPEEYHREPALGLLADDEGLALVLRILREAAHYLRADGILIVEVGNSAEALNRRYPDAPFLWLEFERGGNGVFLLTEQQLREFDF